MLYLDAVDPSTAEGSLSPTIPEQDDSYTYVYDPAVDDSCGYVYTGSAAYISPPFTEPMEIAGIPELVLHMTVDVPDTDVFAYLFELRVGDPQWHMITSGNLRLRFRNAFTAPEPVVEGETLALRLKMVAVGYRIAVGSKLALLVTSSECGQSENPNTGEDMVSATETQAAHITILTGPTSPTHLVVPVVTP